MNDSEPRHAPSKVKKTTPQPQSQKSGQFLPSKQMVFGMDSKKLEPTEYSTSQHGIQQPSRDTHMSNKYPIAEAPTLQTQIVK